MGPIGVDDFAFEQLPDYLHPVAKPFHDLAATLIEAFEHGGDDLQDGLRALLDAREAFLRAARAQAASDVTRPLR